MCADEIKCMPQNVVPLVGQRNVGKAYIEVLPRQYEDIRWQPPWSVKGGEGRQACSMLLVEVPGLKVPGWGLLRGFFDAVLQFQTTLPQFSFLSIIYQIGNWS